MNNAHFTIKNRFQKRFEKYEDILTTEILRDVCIKITGQPYFTVDFDNSEYNRGRLAVLEYEGKTNYISFSEFEIQSRNSFFQSFPSALLRYYEEENTNKQIYFYFLQPDGNIKTPYFIFMYRLMKTAGTIFLNQTAVLNLDIVPFNSASDMIAQRDLNREKNGGNASTYITIDENNVLQIYGKTYGANKYETTLLCLALNEITYFPIELYEIQEGTLKTLPSLARKIIISRGIKVISTDLSFEKAEYETNDSLRSPTYIYNLLEKLGEKKCAFCNCEIPQIIQGAHVWPVASIKKQDHLNLDQKIQCAIDRDNGLWLCNNHHKLFDINLLYITPDGHIKYKLNLENHHEAYLRGVTFNNKLAETILTPNFISYLANRNRLLDESLYTYIE